MRYCGNCGTRLVEKPQEAPPKPSDVNPAQQVGAMVGANLLERFQKAGLAAAGQRRNVTILFVDLSGYTQLSERTDEETLYEIVQRYLQVLANDVYKYEGMVDKFTGDGLMAIFGAPIAQENNAELAIRAALDMHADVAHLSEQTRPRLGQDLQIHIGLHSGSVVVGGIGSNLMMNYTAIGDTVNLAQRLEASAAPGTTLVSDQVYQQTHALFHFSDLATLHLKGISRPIRGYRLVGAKIHPGLVRGVEGLQAPMIGREAELENLIKAGGALLEKKEGSFVLITGEAGIGKSRLIRELKTWLTSPTMDILEGQCVNFRRTIGYWIILEALRGFLDVSAETSPYVVREKLEAKVTASMGVGADEAIPYFEHLFSLPFSDPLSAERLRYLDASQLRQQVFISIRDWITAEARQRPILLILEDLHWADQASLDLLYFLLDSVRQVPLLILAISRPATEGTLNKITEWAKQNLETRFYNIQLQNLTHAQSETLLYQLLETPEIPPQIHDQILERAAGIPFYLEEILRMLIDRGLFRKKNGRWKASPEVDLNLLDVPNTLEGLILARFDRLTEVQRRILQIASVIGVQFNLQVLQSAAQPIDKNSLNASLGYLTDHEFVQPQSDSPLTEYAFWHTLMSDAIYKTLLKRDSSELHGQIGQTIESISGNNLDSQVEILARHYSLSPRKERALYYLILAGQKAAQNYANEQARQYFEQALEILPTIEHKPSQDLQVQTGLGDVLVFIGEYSAAREHYQAAVEIISGLELSIYAEELADLHRKIGTTYERQADYDEATACLESAQKALEATTEPSPVVRAQIYNDMGWTHLRQGGLDEAEQNLLKALKLAEASTRLDVIASIYNRLGGVYFQKGQHEKASNYVQKSLALREEMGDIAAVARSHNNLGLLDWTGGRWDSALKNLNRSFELHANLCDIEGIIDLHGNLGLLHMDRGDMEVARQHFEESLKKAQQIGHSYIIGTTYMYLSRLSGLIDDWQNALEYGNQSLKILNEIGAQDDIPDVYTNISQAWLGLGNLEEAKQWAEKALRLFEQRQPEATAQSDERGRTLRLLGEIFCQNKEFERADHFFKESLAIFTARADQLERARCLVSQARLARARQDMATSRVLLNEARLIFRQLGANLDLKKLTGHNPSNLN
jgi:predicted ATPase/class 3 adenylate cyclase